jgi:dienelactone hydrolase
MRIVGLILFTFSLCAAAEKPVPPLGVAVSAADRAALESGIAELGATINKLPESALKADVRVYHDAVKTALTYNEFFKPAEIEHAKDLLRLGKERASMLAAGKPAWAQSPGLIVRGYVSKIDKSVQPYGLVVPPSYHENSGRKWRLDTWFHGRSETLSEVNFLYDRSRAPGEFTPPDTIVLHLYGRFCNANKMAGEVDLFEALDAVKKQYPIDENRIVVRGFSMGGAAAWHIGAHYAGMWAATAPGAGFSETADFLKVFQNELVKPTWWEIKLWHLYDATDYAANFFNTPLVAYSGEIDKQKQAADMMAKALAAEGMTMKHIIGPKTAHKYHPDSKVLINAELDSIAAIGRDAYPRKIRFTTFTLRYNRMKWVVADELSKHYERARIDAEITGDSGVDVKTSNMNAFSFDFGPGGSRLDPSRKVTVTIDAQRVLVGGPLTDRSWNVHFRKISGKWAVAVEQTGLHKIHGLQGPVDDAFFDSFLMVKPSGTPSAWVAAESARAITEWRRQFRGEAQVKVDNEVTDADIAASNLVLWGDPSSNKLLARIASQLPVQWTADAFVVNGKKYSTADHGLILIYPNPLNPKKYVVLNSGFTFREYDYLNNARQIPKLPDWAVVDTRTPPDSRWPGKVVDAGFFGEKWEMLANGGR